MPQAEEMLIQYQQDVDKSLNYTAKSTLIEHYQEQTRENTVMGFAISLIIAFAVSYTHLWSKAFAERAATE